MKYKETVTAYFDSKGIKYLNSVDQPSRISLLFNTDNIPQITVNVFFDEQDKPNVQFVGYDIVKFNEENLIKGLEICNELNMEYRWLTFYINDTHSLVVNADALYNTENCGEISLSYILKMVNIVDQAYPKIMKNLWT